jgi:ketosteroid isomerase-like protein
MSQENVESIRAGMDAWNRGDWDEALKEATPDIVLDNSSNAGEWRGVHRGPEQVKRMWEKFVEPWESVRFEVDEFIDAGEHVVTRQTATFRGRDGIQVEVHTAWCWTFHDGALTRLVASNDPDAAFEAAGLAE